MPTAKTAPDVKKPLKSADVGLGGLPAPDSDGTWKVERTIITPGGDGDYACFGVTIFALHVITWLVAIILSFVASGEISNHAGASDDTKMIALFTAIAEIVSVLFVITHSLFARKEDKVVAPLLTMLVLFALFVCNGYGFITAAQSLNLTTGGSPFGIALGSLIVCNLASAMAVSFLLLWQSHGNLEGFLMPANSYA